MWYMHTRRRLCDLWSNNNTSYAIISNDQVISFIWNTMADLCVRFGSYNAQALTNLRFHVYRHMDTVWDTRKYISSRQSVWMYPIRENITQIKIVISIYSLPLTHWHSKTGFRYTKKSIIKSRKRFVLMNYFL